MMRLRRFLAFAILVSLLVSVLSVFHAVAADDNEKVYTVYASEEEQMAMMDVLSASANRSKYTKYVIPGSITPVYYYMLYDKKSGKGYKAGDEIELSKFVPNMGSTCCYLATLRGNITRSDEQFNSGMFEFRVKNGVITISGPELISDSYGSMSYNYADYAEDIRVLSGKDEIIDPQYVRLVHIRNAGLNFYINDGTDEFFYLISYYVGETDITHGNRIIRAGEDLERAVADIKAFIEDESAIQEMLTGGSSSGEINAAWPEFNTATGDTTNIEQYLGVKTSNFKTHFPEAFVTKPQIWPFIVIPGVVTAAAAVVIVLILRKKRKNVQTEEKL